MHGCDISLVRDSELICWLDEGEGSKYQRSMSMPATPGTPVTPVTPTTPVSARRENVWRSVFHPGSNLATKSIGAEVFDKPQPNSPTVYDWYVQFVFPIT